jgi:hypothetical protein
MPVYFSMPISNSVGGSVEIRIRNLPYSTELRHTLISLCAAKQIKELGIRKYVELCSWKILCSSSLTNMKLANIKKVKLQVYICSLKMNSTSVAVSTSCEGCWGRQYSFIVKFFCIYEIAIKSFKCLTLPVLEIIFIIKF